MSPTFRFDGRVAIVTGGASGIGRSTSLRMLHEGASVVVADLNEETGNAFLTEAASAGFQASTAFIRTDVSSEGDIVALVERTVARFGRLDCLVNNAAVTGAIGPLVDTPVEDWDFTQGVVLRSVFLGIKHAARQMISSGNGGSIVNTASVAGLIGGAGPFAYATAKAGVVNLTRYAAVELAPHRIRVNAICPGAILTPMAHGGDPVAEEAAAARMDGQQPWPAHGTSEQVAAVVTFLASEDSEFVTGESVLVDGGLVAAGVKIMGPVSAGSPSVLNLGSTGQTSIVRS